MTPEWVELRIHGVSGTPPEEMLDVPHVRQVGGDAQRRVFQAAGCDNVEVGRDDGRLLEGYHWGNLTSGSWRQALWLLLIPFGLINAAQFMLPPAPSAGSDGPGDRGTAAGGRVQRAVAVVAHVACGVLLRLIGLAQTVLLSFAATFIVMELVARQWAGHLTVADTPGGLPLRPGSVLAGGLVGSVAVVFVLYWAGGRIRHLQLEEEPNDARHWRTSKLRRSSFFAGDLTSRTLRRLHLAAGAMIAIWLSGRAADADTFSTAALVLLAVITLVVAVIGDTEGSASMDLDRTSLLGRSRALVRSASLPVGIALFGLAVLALVVALVELWKLDTVSPDALPGLDRTAEFLYTWNVALALVLLAVNGLLAALTRAPERDREVRRRFGRYAGGMAAGVVSALAVYLGLGLSSAFTYAAAKLLQLDDDHFPEVVHRTAYAWGVSVLVYVALLLAIAAHWRGTRRRFLGRVGVDFADLPGGRALPDGWEGSVATAMWSARVKCLLPHLAITMTVTGSVLSLAAGYELFHARGSWWVPSGVRDDELPVGWLSGTVADGGWLMWLGTTTLLLLAVQLVFLGRGAISAQSKRRGTSILWDIIAFWPHSAHPFAPPPYSQVVVLHFRDWIRWHLYGQRGPGDRPDVPCQHVVVAAHSQGSLIAVAALMWLTDEERAHVGLLTFGSQLQVAFPRAFPDYVNAALLREMSDRLDHRWINLYRETDPIAGPVLSWGHWTETPDGPSGLRAYSFAHPESPDGRPPLNEITESGRRRCGDDWRLLDPTPADPGLFTGAVAKIRGHSYYYTDPDWAAAVEAVRVPAPGPGPAGRDGPDPPG